MKNGAWGDSSGQGTFFTPCTTSQSWIVRTIDGQIQQLFRESRFETSHWFLLALKTQSPTMNANTQSVFTMSKELNAGTAASVSSLTVFTRVSKIEGLSRAQAFEIREIPSAVGRVP
jgi:hypothetical protein